ncbi:MAG: hypothetical protein QM689_01665 [Oscillospiraceae bacterium]
MNDQVIYVYPTEQELPAVDAKIDRRKRAEKRMRWFLLTGVALTLLCFLLSALIASHEKISTALLAAAIITLIVTTFFYRRLAPKAASYLYMTAYEDRMELCYVRTADGSTEACIYYEDIQEAIFQDSSRTSLLLRFKDFQSFGDASSYKKVFDLQGDETDDFEKGTMFIRLDPATTQQSFFTYTAPSYFNIFSYEKKRFRKGRFVQLPGEPADDEE